MYRLAWAKLSTPIMEKIKVKPLDNMNNSKPYTNPLSREEAISSVTG